MTEPRVELPTLRAFLGAIACRKTASTSANLSLRSLQGALTESDRDVQDVVNAIVAALDTLAASGGPFTRAATDTNTLLAWALDEADGSTAFVDRITGGANYDLAIAPATNYRAGIGRGMFQRALNLYGTVNSGRRLSGAGTITPSATAWTISAWIRMIQGTYGLVCYKQYRTSGGYSGWTAPFLSAGLGIDSYGVALRAQVCVSGALTTLVSPQAVNIGEATFAAATYDGHYLRIYQQGILVATSSDLNGSTDWGTENAPWAIGQDGNLGTPSAGFIGDVWDVRVHSVVRSAAELAAIYKAGVAMP